VSSKRDLLSDITLIQIPILGKPRSQETGKPVSSGNDPEQSIDMSAAAEIPWTPQESKRELQSLFEHSPFAWAQCGPDGNICSINSALERILANKPRIARSLCFADLIHPRDRVEAERLLAELFAQQQDSFQLDSQTPEANSQRVRWIVWRVPGTNPTADSALILRENAVPSYDAEQRLRQAQRLETVGRLAGGVAHDFNNYLTGVLLYCDLLLANLEPGHGVRKYAEEIRSAGVLAAGLVRQLLSAARPTACEPCLCSLNEIAEGMRSLLGRLIGENIELKYCLDLNLGLVRMDTTQAQQILLNLVLNARDAMPAGGQITIETSNCKMQVLDQVPSAAGSTALLPCALFAVADNGCGMDAETRTHLFEAFFTTKAGKGTGLGLATVYDIVTSYGGLIHVGSAPACGTRVSVLLPLVPEEVLGSAKNHDFQAEKNPGELIPKEKEEEE
jgi:two-component system cell cycle sensor histidine kinase/response regulator CckA